METWAIHRGDASLFWVPFEFHEGFLGHQGMGLFRHWKGLFVNHTPVRASLQKKLLLLMVLPESSPMLPWPWLWSVTRLWVSWEVESAEAEAREEDHVVTIS